MPANTESIPVAEALRLCEMALEDCDKATPGPWEIRHEFNIFGSRLVANCGGYFNNTKSDEIHSENVANSAFIVLSRAVMCPLLEYIRLRMTYEDSPILCDDWLYPPLAALRDYYDKARPDWRKS